MSEYNSYTYERKQRHREYLERQRRREENHRAYMERQVAREQRQREYEERQARREENHRAYLERQAQREANREAYFNRVSNNVERFRNQYTQQLTNLMNQGLEQYLPSEFATIRNRISQLGSLLANDDVDSARDLSMQIGNEIHSLGYLARNAQREFAIKEQQRQHEIAELQQQATSEVTQFIQGLLMQITDPIEMDFAFGALKQLQKEYADQTINPQQLENIKNTVLQRVAIIKQDAVTKATTWKKRKIAETQKESQTAFIDQVKQNIEADKNDNPEAVQAAVNVLETLKAKASANMLSVEKLQEQLVEETDKVDGEIADETVRREVVKSIYQSLKNTGFIVDAPQLEGDVVVIHSQKPAGAEARFDVKLNGNLTFKFDHYEGKKCRKDIDEVTQLLDECYGVKLSDKKVLWENPDRIQKNSKEYPTGGETKTMNG
ncbi:MAG: hypothetical protein LBH59_07760 [Planctomycetaceae bacterium]|jgi:hypothetical protein|nr:hypothetical protein [Planctomycetaceae bacterium]